MAKKTILIVDDEQEILDLLEENLQKQGYRVITASDGKAGYDKAVSEVPDLILLDIIMPHGDGLTILRRLKAHEKTFGIPIIMLTAKGGTDTVFEGGRYGATDYLIKPFKLRDLFKYIERYLRIKEAFSKD